MDFFTQEVFHPAKYQQQNKLLWVSMRWLYVCIYVYIDDSSLTFHLAAAQPKRWGTRGAPHQWRQVLPWWRDRNRNHTQFYDNKHNVQIKTTCHVLKYSNKIIAVFKCKNRNQGHTDRLLLNHKTYEKWIRVMLSLCLFLLIKVSLSPSLTDNWIQNLE